MEKTVTSINPTEILRQPYGRIVVPDSDGTYRAEIIEFPGCIATGETAAEALANLEDTAWDWLDAALLPRRRHLLGKVFFLHRCLKCFLWS